MTSERSVKPTEVGWKREILSAVLLGAMLVFGILLSGEVSEYVKEGMKLAVGCVIPSSFPFMILSDLYVAYGAPENIRPLKAILTRVFDVPENGLGALICGNVGGFPIGAKACAELYTSGKLSKDEAERLMPLSNNPSCAFIVGGVGIGMWGDVKIGIILLISVYASTMVCALLTRSKHIKSDITEQNIKQNYSFVDSVKGAGMSTIGIISFICLFSVICGIIKKRVKYAFILYPVYSLLEVTNAVGGFSSLGIFPPTLRLAACAFSLGFGGFSVGMQSSVFASSRGLKMKKYYSIKLLEGILAGSIASLLNQI